MAPTGACCWPLVADRKVVVAVLTTAAVTTVVVSIFSSQICKTLHKPSRNEPEDNEAAHPGFTLSYHEEENVISYDNPTGIIETLKGMECKPRLEKVSTMDIVYDTFGAADERRDNPYFPIVLPVYRCNPDTSFCYRNKYGEENGTCLPLIEVNKTYTVSYLKNGELQNLSLTVNVHKECGCLKKEETGERKERQGGQENAKECERERESVVGHGEKERKREEGKEEQDEPRERQRPSRRGEDGNEDSGKMKQVSAKVSEEMSGERHGESVRQRDEGVSEAREGGEK